MKNEYRIKIEGKITKVNSKEEYEEFKVKYNNYEFMMTNRINEVEAVRKPLIGAKQKRLSKWDMLFERLDRIEADISGLKIDMLEVKATLKKHEEILMRHEEILNKHSEILMRHEEILNKHSEILMRHEEILNKHSEIFERNSLA